jgi:hypothetical protein
VVLPTHTGVCDIEPQVMPASPPSPVFILVVLEFNEMLDPQMLKVAARSQWCVIPSP